MYTQDEYFYGWLFYLLGVSILMGCGWLLTTRIPFRELRSLIRWIAAVTLLVPWYAAPDVEYLAPAWLIAAFEGVFEGGDAFWRAGKPLLIALAVAVGMFLVLQISLRLLSNRRPSTHSSDSP